MFRGKNKLAIASILVSGLVSCKTTQTMKVDKERGEMELFSVDDKSTALPDPNNSDAINKLVLNLEENKKQKKSTDKDMLNLAQLYLVKGELESAESTIRDILRKNLKNDEARLILADILYRKGMVDMAAIILNNLGGLESKNSKIINLMALVALKNNENSKALSYFREALKFNSSDIAVRMNLGVLFLQYRQINEAATQFERVLAVVPNHQDAKLHLATILVNRQQFAEAEVIYKDILKENKNNSVALYNYAVLMNETNRYEDAVEQFKMFIESETEKSDKTSRAFAMIDKIRTKMISDGEKYSNEDIQELAQDLDKRAVETASVADVEKKSSPKEGMAAKPLVKKAPIQPQAGEEKATETKPQAIEAPKENTDDLEKMLMD